MNKKLKKFVGNPREPLPPLEDNFVIRKKRGNEEKTLLL